MHLYNIYPKFIMVNPSEMWIKPLKSGDNQTCVQHSHLLSHVFEGPKVGGGANIV